MTTKLAKWASEHDQIIKSRLSYGHQANPFHQKRGWPTIGSDLMVIWEMSAETDNQNLIYKVGWLFEKNIEPLSVLPHSPSDMVI